MIAKLAPSEGIENVRVTDEDEYFPPPRELRDLLPSLDILLSVALGGDPDKARELGGAFRDDRTVSASVVLETLKN